eukprot:CAMPEP_0172864650 /NCGR_PEP_ID=MMETSP1075-20121228/80942_1 /TAXON_ID=2916 /ORGANISM="Ceratium fusus, Strain PA161109" /LENGTH=76 /DNA_ID=CAMNT_0013713593 /DNA_START=596 /DNA_END=824 /DNA_ORIENTATION=-
MTGTAAVVSPPARTIASFGLCARARTAAAIGSSVPYNNAFGTKIVLRATDVADAGRARIKVGWTLRRFAASMIAFL